MRIVLFCHSIVSDWNHGNAHFLRGVMTELVDRGHDVRIYEPAAAWSVVNLLADAGPGAIEQFRRIYPRLDPVRFDAAALDLDQALDGADLVLVHEWNDAALVERIGRHHSKTGRYTLLFHDTHHRAVSDAEAVGAYDLQHYDAVLAFGEVIRRRYVARGWASRAFTWHEAADTRVFTPTPRVEPSGDLVWIGNWGDEERSQEIRDYLIRPVAALGLRSRVHGVRYPADAIAQLRAAGIEYGGWLPNYRVPEVFGRHRFTIHIPRRPYVEAIPGVPTIRVFEALACGIPLVSCWWDDCEGLFTAGEDFTMIRTPDQMQRALAELLHDPARASALATHGLETIRQRHSCAHRVDELLAIAGTIRGAADREVVRA
jgi:spore maturation protein CgeB